MTQQDKLKIIEQASNYVKAKGLTQAELAILASIPTSYVNHMLKGKDTVGETVIDVKYWRQLRDFTKEDASENWPLVHTPQFKRLITALTDARKKKTSRSIVGAPGCGKSMTIHAYKAKFPKHTYVIILNDLLSMNDIVGELLKQLGLPEATTQARRFYDVVAKLRSLALEGAEPIVICDEAENVKVATMKLLKGFYDRLNGAVPIVLIGTDQLPRKMRTMKSRDKDAAPQFYRRFNPGMVFLEDIDIDQSFTVFFEVMGVKDMGLRKLLCELCEDYGMLNTYLQPVMEEASKQNKDLTEGLFRVYWNMPNLVRRK